MMVSGSNVSAADIKEHFSEYTNLVTPLAAGPGDGGAECASGDVVRCRGKVQVYDSMNGRATSISFRDMDINVMIASMLWNKRNTPSVPTPSVYNLYDISVYRNDIYVVSNNVLFSLTYTIS